MNKEASPEEISRLFRLLSETEIGAELSPLMEEHWQRLADAGDLANIPKTKIAEEILKVYPAQSAPAVRLNRKKKIRYLLQYAAAVVFIVAIGAYYVSTPTDGDKLQQEAATPLTPSEHTTLALADGTVLVLEDVNDSTIISQGNSSILKLGNELRYTSGRTDGEHQLLNTISTPKGGEYTIVLSDGSKVHLNAHSSLTFPVSFTHQPQRNIVLNGEGYFEIQQMKDANNSIPFYVDIMSHLNQHARIEVLGTIFNVMAYKEEDVIRTTLLEGSVRLTLDKSAVVLSPGEQAVVAPGESIQILEDVNIDHAVEWKNGVFRFENTGIQAIMRQIERWYDVTIHYDESMPEIKLSGKIEKKESVQQLLDILTATQKINFRITGKQIVVQPNR